MVRLGLILCLGMIAPWPATAQEDDLDDAQAVTCFNDMRWDCVFDRVLRWKPEDGPAIFCRPGVHGCLEVWQVAYISGIGAAQDKDADGRRKIAESALELVKRANEGIVEEKGELHFSALRYDACKTLGDDACVTDSAATIRRAVEVGVFPMNLEDVVQVDLSGTNVVYPLDLDAIIAEIMQTDTTP
jgi:hypothetical protein